MRDGVVAREAAGLLPATKDKNSLTLPVTNGAGRLPD
jgi:hypothetical protein